MNNLQTFSQFGVFLNREWVLFACWFERISASFRIPSYSAESPSQEKEAFHRQEEKCVIPPSSFVSCQGPPSGFSLYPEWFLASQSSTSQILISKHYLKDVWLLKQHNILYRVNIFSHDPFALTLTWQWTSKPDGEHESVWSLKTRKRERSEGNAEGLGLTWGFSHRQDAAGCKNAPSVSSCEVYTAFHCLLLFSTNLNK